MISIKLGHYVTCSNCDYRYFCTCTDFRSHSETCRACRNAETGWSWDMRKEDDVSDWTLDAVGKTNSSKEFLGLVDEVARLMRNDYKLGDDPRRTAGLIMAQLAHVHKLGPGIGS